jgi:hypothetical protein
VIWRRETSLLFAALIFVGCASGPPPKPDIPDSISPGWKLLSLDKSALPAGVPAGGSPECWKADYASQGFPVNSAEAWICWYKASGSAFDAAQRTSAEAQTVKFQEEHYFVLVKWNNAPRASLTALVRALQKALQPSR